MTSQHTFTMNRLPFTLLRATCLAAVITALAGCASSTSRPTLAYDRPVYLPAAAPIGRGYRYYPDYEVFHSFSRGHFVYQEGEKWPQCEFVWVAGSGSGRSNVRCEATR